MSTGWIGAVDFDPSQGLACSGLTLAPCPPGPACLSQGADPRRSAPAHRPIMLMAHRGAKKFAPENTLPAIEKATELRTDFAEVDVHSTRDGHLVLMHDPDVDRTTDGRGFVYDMSLDQVKALDAGVRFHTDFKGVRVPTLEEALDAAKGRIRICIHWKDATSEALASSFEKAHAWDSALVLGSARQVAALRRVDPRIRVITDVYSLAALEAVVRSEDRPYGVSPGLSWLSVEVVAECHGAGIIVFAGAAGPMEDCVQVGDAVEMGVDVVQTDDPDGVLRCLEAPNGVRWRFGSGPLLRAQRGEYDGFD